MQVTVGHSVELATMPQDSAILVPITQIRNWGSEGCSQSVSGKTRSLTQTWSQLHSESITDLLLWKVSSARSDETYGINSDLIIPVLKMEIPTKKAQTPSSPGGVCLLQRKLQGGKNGWFYFGFSWSLVSPELSEHWQVQLVPGKSGLCSQQAQKPFRSHKPQERSHARGDRNVRM